MMPSKLKFMQLDTFYDAYLNGLYARDMSLATKSYNQQIETLFFDGFAAIHSIAPYMADLGYECQWIIGNNRTLQTQWALENSFDISDRNTWMYDIVREQVARFKPDVLYTTDSMVFDSRFIRTLPWLPRLVMGWQASDIPADTDWSAFDIILSPLAALRKAAIALGAKSAEHFYPGFPQWIHDAVKNVEPNLDLVFCGQWTVDQHLHRNQLLQQIAQNAVHPSEGFSCGLYLSGQVETIPQQMAYCNRGPRFGIEMYRALRTGKIGIDARATHRCFSNVAGQETTDIGGSETANMRIFETTGVGTFLLAEYHDNLPQLFLPGKEIETFTNKQEMIDKIRYYLAHPSLREEIAWNGRERCAKEHSMLQRTKVLHQLIVKHLQAAPDGIGISDSIVLQQGPVKKLTADNDLSNIRTKALEERFGNWLVKFRGLSIACHDLLSFYMAAKDIFLHRIYDFQTDNSVPRIIDGGGHIGLFTLFIKQRYPDAKVTVFEPEASSLRLLRHNLQQNGFNDVEIVEAGLFGRDGILGFGSDSSDGSSLFSETKGETINVVRISPCLNEEVDFLKLNIEGAELEVITELEPKLHMVREIVIEYHGFPEVGQRLHNILTILDRNGFRYMIHDFDGETNPASKPPFILDADTRFFLLISSKRLFPVNHSTVDGNFHSIEPQSRQFGFDRGVPIDRFYIERFLKENCQYITGSVLEVGDNSYTQMFGTDVEQSHVLSAVSSSGVTIVGDLASGKNIPEKAFDCVILTQTIQMIYDVKSALKHAMRALKPGGSLLLTAPGISQISRYDMDRWGDFWRFTSQSLQMLLMEAAPEANIQVSVYGNVAVAKAFLDGIAMEELPPNILDYQDDDYQVVLSARVVKPDNSVSVKTQKPLVLIYHRVSDLDLDPQLLCVSPDNFDAHLQELAQSHRVVPLYQMLEECRNSAVPHNTVSLTFDDGYLDNLTNALPLLEKHGMHATVFVTSGMVCSDEEFWWDAMERIFLTGINLPQELSFAGRQWQLHTDEEKLTTCDDLCSLLRDYSPEVMEQSLQFLFSWAGISTKGRASHSVVDSQQLRQLAASPLIEIGAHAKHHVRLSRLPAHRQRIEVTTSKQQLEAVIGKPIRLFSYPFGTAADFTTETVQAVMDAGYHAAIANIQSEITFPLDQYAVPRRLVRNWCKTDFSEWMRSIDKDALEAVTIQGRKSTILRCISNHGRS